jgi:glycosyltransferase involved in cell wall biosynthesis
MKLFVNGRFLTQPVSGVQRYAIELLSALNRIILHTRDGNTGLPDIEVLVPAGGHADPGWAALPIRVVGGAGGHIWEQTSLFHASRDGVLLSLGNSGPLRHTAQVLALHDAHIYEISQAYSRRYLAWHRMSRPILTRRAAALITVSAHSAKSLAYHLDCDAARFSVVPNAADHVLRWPLNEQAPGKYGLKPNGYILTVGNQSANKNIRAFADAHAKGGDILPALAVTGGDADALRSDLMHPNARVQVLGRVTDSDLRGLLQGAAGFAFPSLHEGFGIPPLEAMQLGIPVLCATSGAMPEVLGDAPLWFDPTDAADMTRALVEFVRLSKRQRDQMIKRGLAQARQYRWEQSALRLMAVLRKATAALPRAA